MNGKLKTAIRLFSEDRSQIPYAIFRNMTKKGLTKFISDKQYIKIAYRLAMQKKLNLKNPQTFNEKLQWLKLYDRNPMYITLVDKYRVREYIASKIGQEYLIPLLGVWDTAEKIDFQKLPSQFVLKCNHDSGSVVICKEKSKLDVEYVKRKLNRALKLNGFWHGREWPYKNVKPCIIAEKYMIDDQINELRDYKFFCFGGEVKCFKVDFDRSTEHRANYYDKNCELLKFGEKVCPPDFTRKINIPENINKMIQLAEILSKGFPFVRVDFYDANGKIYFGELTFYPAAGFGAFIPDEWDYKLGEMIKIQ